MIVEVFVRDVSLLFRSMLVSSRTAGRRTGEAFDGAYIILEDRRSDDYPF